MVFLEQQWLVDFRLWSWQWIKVRGQLHDPATSPMRQEPKMLNGTRIRSGPLWTTDKWLLLLDAESRIPSSSSSQPDHYIDWTILWAPYSVYQFQIKGKGKVVRMLNQALTHELLLLPREQNTGCALQTVRTLERRETPLIDWLIYSFIHYEWVRDLTVPMHLSLH